MTSSSPPQAQVAAPRPPTCYLNSPDAPAHDSFTRLLHRLEPDPETFWLEAKPLAVRRRRSLVIGEKLRKYSELPREKLNDSDRVYPGDGVAPLREIFRTLGSRGFRVNLSLEVFNRDYWKLDPLVVARTGLEKMKAVVASTSGV